MANINILQAIIDALRDIFSPSFDTERDIIITIEQENYWQEGGWVRNGNRYEGVYRVRMSKYRGEFLDKAGAFDVFIFDPPYRFKKSCCVHDRSGGKFWVHLDEHPADVNSAILNVERMIAGTLKV